MKKTAWEEWWLYFITNYSTIKEDWISGVMTGKEIPLSTYWDNKRIEWAKENGHWFKTRSSARKVI